MEYDNPKGNPFKDPEPAKGHVHIFGLPHHSCVRAAPVAECSCGAKKVWDTLSGHANIEEPRK